MWANLEDSIESISVLELDGSLTADSPDHRAGAIACQQDLLLVDARTTAKLSDIRDPDLWSRRLVANSFRRIALVHANSDAVDQHSEQLHRTFTDAKIRTFCGVTAALSWLRDE